MLCRLFRLKLDLFGFRLIILGPDKSTPTAVCSKARLRVSALMPISVELC